MIIRIINNTIRYRNFSPIVSHLSKEILIQVETNKLTEHLVFGTERKIVWKELNYSRCWYH